MVSQLNPSMNPSPEPPRYTGCTSNCCPAWPSTRCATYSRSGTPTGLLCEYVSVESIPKSTYRSPVRGSVSAWSTYALLFVTNASTGVGCRPPASAGTTPVPYSGIGTGEKLLPPSVLV